MMPLVPRPGLWLCVAGATLGAVGLLGHILGLNVLTTIVPGQPAMMPNTALGLVLIGSAGALRQSPSPGRVHKALSVTAAFIVLAIGIGTLAEYALDVNLRIDQLLFATGTGPAPGRPSPPTALALTFLAASVLLSDVRATASARPSEWLAFSASATALTALMGFIFGAGPLYRLSSAPVIGVAVPTATSLLLTSMGLLLERPAAGIMRVATSTGPGGVLLRRLVVPAILAPVLLGLVVMRFAAAVGIDDPPVVVAMLAAILTAASLVVLTLIAVPLNRTHEALEASRMRTRSLVEQAPDGIFVADLHGRYTDVNDAGCRLLGFAREEIIGKTIVDFIPPEDVARLMKSRDQLLQGATHFDEWRIRSSDGSYLPVEVSSKILPDGRWQGFVRDIRERQRLENELRLSEEKATGIISISSDAIISVDEGYRITLFNEGAEKIFGYSKTEAIGASLDILIPERLRGIHRHHVAQFATDSGVARGMGTRDALIVGRRKNGEEFPAGAAISKLEVAGTRILTVVLRDITHQKRIENEQRFLAEVGPVLATSLDYEETLSRVAELAVHSLADVCIVDLVEDTNEVRRLRVVSRDPSRARTCEVLRVLVDHKLPRLIRAALESRQPVLIPRVSSQDLEALALTDDHLEALRAIELQSVMAMPLLAQGRLLGVISLLSSTPSRIYGLEDLRVAHELAGRAALAVENARLYRAAQRAIQVRDEVLGIVAHDLRNPLSTILVEAHILRERGTEVQTRASGEAIKRVATRMNRLIQDLLDIARMEAGRLTVAPSRLSAADVASAAVGVHKSPASSASLELRLEVPPSLPDIRADRDRLLQVFDNLIGNAIKFTPGSGCITVGAELKQDDVRFYVRDTGPGIPLDDQPHLFDRFWQARQEGRSGAGLGLPIVKAIVEAHGRRVWVESTPGHGTTVLFTIPAAPRTG
jgi:PAS domain S-box-containing protein